MRRQIPGSLPKSLRQAKEFTGLYEILSVPALLIMVYLRTYLMSDFMFQNL